MSKRWLKFTYQTNNFVIFSNPNRTIAPDCVSLRHYLRISENSRESYYGALRPQGQQKVYIF
jgi:hypothetical protein